MKYMIACLIALFIGTAHAAPAKEVVIFSKDHCPYCEQLKTDLDTTLIAAYPNVKFTVLNIKEDDNIKRLRQLARKHKMESVGLPLVFVGDDYFMGWGDTETADKLKQLLQ